MATLIPDTPPSCPHGERAVYEKLQRDLADRKEWVILHSLGLVEHEKKLWGEIDFVVLSTKGIFVIEVKGGKVRCEKGWWIYEAPGEQPIRRREAPWSQAAGGMFALRERVRREWPEFDQLLLGYGVVMPHEVFTATGTEIEPAVLLDRREFRRNLGFYIGELERHWDTVYRQRYGRPARRPTSEEIRRLRKILRPDADSAFTLGTWLNGLDAELIHLTNGQIRAARRMAANVRTVVRGRAGTGKTILAIERAKLLAGQGLDVLYLCFNRLLANHVEESLRGYRSPGRIRVRHIHALFRDICAKAGLASRLDVVQVPDAELFGRVYPETFCEASLSVDPGAADAVIVDEAQDLLTPDHLDALDMLVKDGLTRGCWHLFLDPMQNIYGKDAEVASQRLEQTTSFTWDELYENCRNTRRVAVQTSIMSGVDMAIEGTPEGPPCDVHWYRDQADLLRKLDSHVVELLKSEIAPERMILLSTRTLANSTLSGRTEVGGLPLVELKDALPASGGLHFSTMHAFKGLERDAVIALDLDRLGDSGMSMLHYVGLSRARLLLVPFVPETCRIAYGRLAADFARRASA
jgi:hypothetical protein